MHILGCVILNLVHGTFRKAQECSVLITAIGRCTGAAKAGQVLLVEKNANAAVPGLFSRTCHGVRGRYSGTPRLATGPVDGDLVAHTEVAEKDGLRFVKNLCGELWAICGAVLNVV